jgi:pimeloyl-ACP methyl ester carboxylesterase
MKALLFSVILILSAAHSAVADHDKALADVRAEYFWRMVVEGAANSKAIAAASNGAVGYAYGMSSDAEAAKAAMEFCTERSKFIALKKPPAQPCEVLGSSAGWIAPGSKLDPDWQTPTTGKDTTMGKGRKLTIKNSEGIILMVHGCDGLGDKIFTDIWGAYFNAMGYDVYAPDSFAVKRPKPVCGTLQDFSAAQISTVWRLRIAQTQRHLADLKKANPDKPIYLFGHSEGGLIVQMVKTDVAGVIVSGEECGVLGAPVAAAATVPLLYIWGEFDQYVNGLGYRISDASTKDCATRMASHKPQFAVLQGRSHIPWPWNEKVNSSIATFLGKTAPVIPKQQAANKKSYSNWKRTTKDKRYRTAAPHRSAAINSSGTSYMTWGLDNEEDARQLALFGCTRATNKKTNVFKTGKYLCATIDVNGKSP